MKRTTARPHLLRTSDLLTDVAIELSARMARTVLLVTAVALSTGALLASVAISHNAARQVDADLAAATINLITITPASQHRDDDGGSDNDDGGGTDNSDDNESDGAGGTDDSGTDAHAPAPTAGGEGSDTQAPAPTETAAGDAADAGQPPVQAVFPDDTEARLQRLEAVAAAGSRLAASSATDIRVDRPVAGVKEERLEVAGITAGYPKAAGIATTGHQQWMLDGTDPVAYLGTGAAKKLAIPVTSDLRGVTLDLNGVTYSVVGFLPGDHTLTEAIAIPYHTALAITGNDFETQVLVRTASGAGAQVSRVARHAVLPATPEQLTTSQVVTTDRLRQGVSAQLARQATWVGAFLIVLTILLITNSMIVSVMARTTEIGVRRALGASRAAVAAVFWAEGALTGVLGGLAGSAVSATATVTVAALNGWTAHLNPAWIGLGPLLGVVVGLLASAYPALRASGVHPAIAVRSD